MNYWLPRPYFTVYVGDRFIGNYTTEESANEAYKQAKKQGK